MRIHSGLSRFVSWLLVLCMVMSCLPIYTYSTTPEQGEESESASQEPGSETVDTFFDRVKLYVDGQQTRYAELSQEGHVTLTAQYEGGEENVDSFTWQIYDPVDCCWIPISGSNKADLQVGVALLGEMLNEENIAILNCKIYAGGALYFSDSLQIKLVEAVQEPEASEEPAEETQELEDTQEQEEISAPSAPMTRSVQSRAVEGDAAGGELITYTVRVEYINHLTQKEAAKPYIATVKKGTEDLTVYPDSPIVVGFTPYIITKDGIKDGAPITAADEGAEVVYEYVDENNVKQQIYGIETHKLKLELSSVSSDMTYQVVYMPNKVYYTVSHYVQNIVNDDYVLYYVETKQGYVGQMTEATNLSEEHPTDPSKAAPLADGFTALTPFKDQPIAADGTTQINTYYDRMYFLVTFKLDGGRGTEPIYARYGASVHTTIPQKTGYTFAGWLKLEMVQSEDAAYTPRPAVDASGNYKPLYTDAERHPVMDSSGNFYYVQLVSDTDGDGNDEYWGPVDGKGNLVSDTNWPYSQYTLISNDQLPATMPAFHSAMLAVWHKADTEYTVIYWLEHADRTGTNDVLTEDDFDYWCAVTRYAKSGTRLDAIYKELENPLLPYIAPEIDMTERYIQLTDITVEALDKHSFAVVTDRFAKLLTTEVNGNGLSKGSFSTETQTTEWTFEKQEDGTFKLHSNGSYLVLTTSGTLSLDPSSENATSFTVNIHLNDSYSKTPAISLKIPDTDMYVSEVGGNDGQPIQGYESDDGKFLKLYSFRAPDAIEDIPGTGASAINAYSKVTGIADMLDKLHGFSFALVSHSHNQNVLNTETTAGYNSVAGLERGTFATNEQTVEWTFVQVSGNTYKLKNGDHYMRMDGNKLYCDATDTNATIFTVEQHDTQDSVTIGYNNQYINSLGGSGFASFAGYGTRNDPGCAMDLYNFIEIDDPEGIYYYYYYSDLRDLDTENNVAFEKVNEITVSDDGKTTVNVYFRRREYNLRFFYARSSGEGDDKQYQVIGGTSYGFSTNDRTTTSELLKSVADSQWGNVKKPEFVNTNNWYKEGSIDLDNGYTYYYFIYTARYGQNIADEWPSENMLDATRSEANTHGWDSDVAVFSAWNGEYWLKYSRDEAKSSSGANYTIKGNYQVMDEVLMYDPSFNDPSEGYNAEDIDSEGNRYGYYYERGTGTRYLDFVAFYENGADISWSIPNQFHYYIWAENPEQGSDAVQKAQEDGVLLSALPCGRTDFENNVHEGSTKIVIDNVLYVLYDKVDSADDDVNRAEKQTVPGIPGYDYFGNKYTGGYSDYDGTILYYRNRKADGTYDYDTDTYAGSYSLNFRYTPKKKNITLQNWNHIKVLPNIAYGSMTGATWITKGMTLKNGEFDPGYMFDQMMSDYYPSDLPEGAYYFAGWYKTPEFIEGTMANFDKPMPNYNMILYAKWEPIRFNVHVHQTSELSDLVYYPDEDDGGKHKPMKAEVTQVPLVVHGQTIMVGQEGTGKGYGEYLPKVVPAAGPDKTFTGEDKDGERIPTIAENCSDLDYVDGSGQIRSKWIFVCYAYMKDGVEHAVDVSSFTITEDVELYAKWTAMDIVSYRVDYVVADVEVKVNDDGTNTIYALRPVVDADGNPVYNENGTPQYIPYPNYVEIPGNEDVTENHWPMTFNDRGRLVYADNDEDMSNNEEWIPKALTVTQDEAKMMYVADSISGKVNEGANRTFEAKTGNELYEIYQFGYFPLHISHSTLMTRDPVTDAGESEENPIVTTFYYVPLTSVPYRVKYLDKLGNAMVDIDGDGVYDSTDKDGYLRENSGSDMAMVVTENYVYREGYAPDAFQKTLVLSANLDANVITFVYEKADGQAPYNIQYYYETLGDVVDDTQDGKNYLLHHELSGRVNKNGPLDVDYLDITGFEYAKDIVTMYGLGADNMPVKSGENTRYDRGDYEFELSYPMTMIDPRGHEITVDFNTDGSLKLSCDNSLHAHKLENSVLQYEPVQGEIYRVESITRTDGTKMQIAAYRDPTGSFTLENTDVKVELGEYGTVIKVYYDLKLYPYYIIHKVDGGEELQVILGIEKFQSSISGKAWPDEELIEQGYAGYAAKDEDKSITVTMTIQDDASTPHINTITFLYYEKMMEFDYVPMLLKNTSVVPMPEDEPNAKINLVRDYIKTATGTADAAHPVVYEDAFEFLGWFLDPECTKPVANSAARLYLGTGYEQKDGNSTLVEQLGEKNDTTQDMSQDAYKQYDTLLPQKKVKDYKYWNSDKEGGAGYEYIDLANGVYVGGFDETTKSYEQTETFYALFMPIWGNLTITRSNVGPNAGLKDAAYNQANSFVYLITGTTEKNDPIEMRVTLGPENFVADENGNYSASVTVILPRGSYTVTQVNDWSWRYSHEEKDGIVLDATTQFQTAVFTEDMTVSSWLSGFAEHCKNVFGQSQS